MLIGQCKESTTVSRSKCCRVHWANHHTILGCEQDLTVTLVSERSDREVMFKDDPLQRSTINTQSFVDEQEWRLYNEVEFKTESIQKFNPGDALEPSNHPCFECHTHASRRPGFYIFNIFVVMVHSSQLTVNQPIWTVGEDRITGLHQQQLKCNFSLN